MEHDKIRPYRTVDLEQGSPEWKALRLKHATASNVPAICNISPYKTRLQYFEELAYGVDRTVGNAALFARGHAVEAQGRETLREILGISLDPRVVISNRIPELMASLDGFNEQENILFEAKYVSEQVMAFVLNKKIPEHHICQIQAQFLATGADKCFYYAQAPSGEVAIVDLFPEELYAAELEKEITLFMRDVREGKAPEPGDRDFQEIDDPAFAELMNLKLQADEAEKRFDAMKERIAKVYTGIPRIRSHGMTMIRSIRKGNVQYAKIDALKSMDLEPYRAAPSETVTFRIEKAGKNK